MGKHWSNAGKNLDVLPPDLSNPLKAAYKNAGQQINAYMKSGDVKLLEKLDDTLREAIGDADKISGKHLKSFRTSLHAALPPKTGKKLKAVDSQYAKYAVAQKGGAYLTALERDSVFGHRQLQSAIKAKDGDRALVRGAGRLQPMADEAEQTLGRVSPQRSQINIGQPVNTAIAAGSGIMRPVKTVAAITGMSNLVNEPMRKLMTKDIQHNPYLDEILRQLRMTGGAWSND